jgi:3,4-dihydroxy-2-butanone 4-phosphate synthase
MTTPSYEILDEPEEMKKVAKKSGMNVTQIEELIERRKKQGDGNANSPKA